MPAQVDQARGPRRPRFDKPARDGFEILTPPQNTVEKCDGTLRRRTIEALECQLYAHRRLISEFFKVVVAQAEEMGDFVNQRGLEFFFDFLGGVACVLNGALENKNTVGM